MLKQSTIRSIAWVMAENDEPVFDFDDLAVAHSQLAELNGLLMWQCWGGNLYEPEGIAEVFYYPYEYITVHNGAKIIAEVKHKVEEAYSLSASQPKLAVTALAKTLWREPTGWYER